ncbi:MAG: response regulator [Armatimonadia bacterium]
MSANKPTILIVEDEVTRRDFFREIFEPLFGRDWPVFAENALEGIAKIRRSQYDIIFLDHDLGPDEALSGTDVAACVYRSCNQGSSFFVHSMNPGGSARMVSILRDMGCRVVECAYCTPGFGQRAIEFVQQV